MSKIFPILSWLESLFARFQGKGWKAPSVRHEVILVSKMVSNPKIVIDVGGNRGHYTEALLEVFQGSKIVIFEPAAENIGILRKKFKLNGRVSIEPLALSNTSGQAELYANYSGSALSSLNMRNLDHIGIMFDRVETVKTITFEEYWVQKMDRSEIDFVKLDIEGHELQALKGFGEALKHVGLIQFEFGGTHIDSRTYFRDFWEFLRNSGFELYRMGPLGLNRLEAYSERDEFFFYTNFIAKSIRQTSFE